MTDTDNNTNEFEDTAETMPSSPKTDDTVLNILSQTSNQPRNNLMKKYYNIKIAIKTHNAEEYNKRVKDYLNYITSTSTYGYTDIENNNQSPCCVLFNLTKPITETDELLKYLMLIKTTYGYYVYNNKKGTSHLIAKMPTDKGNNETNAFNIVDYSTIQYVLNDDDTIKSTDFYQSNNENFDNTPHFTRAFISAGGKSKKSHSRKNRSNSSRKSAKKQSRRRR